MKPKISIDLGSSFTKIYRANADVVLYEPTCIAIKKNNYKTPIAFGYEAEKLIGKTSSDVEIIYPVNNVEITNEKALKSLLIEFISRVRAPLEFKPDILFTVPCGATRESIKQFEKIFNDIGYYNIEYAEAPILSLIGADALLDNGKTSFIIDFGGSQTTICALTISGVICGASIEYGGNTLNNLIITHLKDTLEITISENQAENLKTSIAGLKYDDETKVVVHGKDLNTGKPKTSPIRACDIYDAVCKFVDKIVEVTNVIISKLSEDSIDDLHNNAIILTGGGSLLYGLKDYLEDKLSLTCSIPKESEIVVSIGGGIVVENKQLLNNIKLKV